MEEMNNSIKKCNVCNGTKCIAYSEIDMGGHIVSASLRYDFDDTSRNASEMDIELVDYDKTSEVMDLIDWTYGFNTKYCYECGKALNPREDKFEIKDNNAILIDFDIISEQHNDKVKVQLILDKTEKKLIMDLYVNDKFVRKAIDINYDPINGELL